MPDQLSQAARLLSVNPNGSVVFEARTITAYTANAVFNSYRSDPVDVVHGLGQEPVAVVCTGFNPSIDVAWTVTYIDAAIFTAFGEDVEQNPVFPGTVRSFFWIAIA